MLLEGLEPRLAMAIVGLGVAGDSWSDEHAAETYSYSQNWAELLRTQRGVDLGPSVNFPPPNPEGDPPNFEYRRVGTAFNYAFTGATVIDLLIQTQDLDVAELYTDGEVSHAVLMVGNSDVAPGSEFFTNIATSEWSQAEIDNQIAIFGGLYKTAVAGLAGAPVVGGSALKGLVTTIADPTLLPAGKVLFTAADRARVSTAVSSLNAQIRAAAAEYHLPVVDIAALANTVLGTSSSPVSQRTIGGNVYTVSGGSSKTNLFVDGGVVPHTVFNALVANAIIEGLNFAYNENLARFTEQQIVTLAGQTYGGTDTFPINYASLVTQPPVTVFLDFGATSNPTDDFTARMSELATVRNIPQIQTAAPGQPSEMATLKANIVAKLQTAFAGTNVNFVTTKPGDGRYEAIKVGKPSASAAGALTSLLGQNTFDWLNANETSTGYVFPDLIPDLSGATKLTSLPRASQLRYLENILSFYIAQEAGRGMGLSSADAYGYSQITSATAANTGGVQFQDFMSGSPALGFNTDVFNGTPTFRFSPLAQAKLQFGRWVTNPTLTTTAEAGAAHDTTASAQSLALVSSRNAALKVATVKGATIAATGQKDLYKITAAIGDLITAQTFSTGVYGAPIDTVVRLLAADGTTVLATSDNTLLGNNSIGQAGTTNVDSDSLIMNHVAATAGNYFIEVTAGTTGSYDLLVGNTVKNNFPWQNVDNPLNVNASTGPGPLVTAFDALAVINELNNPQIMNPTTFALPTPSGSVAPPPYLDVNASGTCNAFDALAVINFLNANPIGSGPEFIPSAGEALEGTSAAAEEPSAAGSSLLLPSAASQSAVPALSSSRSGQPASANVQPLTWLLLSPATSAGEATEPEFRTCSEAEHAAALDELLTEAE